MATDGVHAPGWPGIPAHWTSGAKSGAGTALTPSSHVWFTLSHGILNEVYYPRIDCASTRDLGLIVTDGHDYFSEEKRHARSEVSLVAPGVPMYHLLNASFDGRYWIEKEVLTDPAADVVLQRIRFEPLRGTLAGYRLFVLLAPHLNNGGSGNTAWVGDYKGTPILLAQRGDHALALACSTPWLARSAGFVGVSDGWQDLQANGHLAHAYQRAENGNVALTGEIDLGASQGAFVLALGFGATPAGAGQRAIGSLARGFDSARSLYLNEWIEWQRALRKPKGSDPDARDFYRLSASLMRVHESKHDRGGVIASLSIPWASGDGDPGGYHLVWPRDLVDTAGAFIAIGAHDEARRILEFLQLTQEADGHWSRNMRLDGSPCSAGIRMDETALPILLVDLAVRKGTLTSSKPFWPMIRRAAGFLARNGPVSGQDRWEDDPGYSPFTLAAEIAALLVAADHADAEGLGTMAAYLRHVADGWHASIDGWIYATNTASAERHGVEGYYVEARAGRTVSADALALVRFGLRAATDPRIVNTIAVIDALLKVDMDQGPAWHRYSGDGYGEHADGRPFDGTGIGRAWPLLTGERAHYELAAGRTDRARALTGTLRAFAGRTGLLPEQIWDAQDIPERELVKGEASGSVRPLVRAHAEYLRLCRSLSDGRVFDLPPQAAARYAAGKAPRTTHAIWRVNNKIRRMPRGRILHVETTAAAVIRWGVNGWRSVSETKTVDTGLGVHVAALATARLASGGSVEFTLFRPDTSRWDDNDYQVTIA